MVAADHQGEALWQLEVAASADLPLCLCQELQACPRRVELAQDAVGEECLKPQQEMWLA